MSQENVEIVRAIFEPLARGDFSRWFDEVTDDFVFVTSPDIPDAGTYRGEGLGHGVGGVLRRAHD